MLIKIINDRRTISNAFPGVKYVILISATENDIMKGGIIKDTLSYISWFYISDTLIDKCFQSQILASELGNVISWNDVLETGKKESDQDLHIRETNQAVNKACMYMYTSGTTGPPKGMNCS